MNDHVTKFGSFYATFTNIIKNIPFTTLNCFIELCLSTCLQLLISFQLHIYFYADAVTIASCSAKLRLLGGSV
ncbi:unnamed protein product [Rhizophagus irregularis]|nr:unnamed protein product [Rhizophagus irregularis]